MFICDDKDTNKQTRRQTNKQTNKTTNKQTYRQTFREKKINIEIIATLPSGNKNFLKFKLSAILFSKFMTFDFFLSLEMVQGM